MKETDELEQPAKEASVSNVQRFAFFVAVAALIALTFAYHLVGAKRGWACYRDQHLGAALEYANGRIDLLNPVIVGFNAGNTPTPQELPIWQATAAVFFKLFGTWFGWANLTSLLFGLASLWPVFQLARAHAGARAASWTLLFFLAQPLVFYLSGRGGTDGSCLTFMVWFMYFADLMLRTGQMRWLWPSALFGALSATTKAPFFFCAGLATFFLLLAHARHSPRRWVMLIATGAAAVGAFALWTRHANAAYAQAEFPFWYMPVNADMEGGRLNLWWFFGDWRYRLTPAFWLKGSWRFLNTELGSFALVLPLVWGLLCSRNRFAQLWFLAGLITTAVFSHLVLTHHNYYLMFSPAVALLCGVTAQRLEQAVGDGKPAASAATIWVATAVLFLCTVQGLIGMKVVLDADPYPKRIAKLIQEHTTADDKLLIQGGGWGGNQLILADRRGLSIWSTEFLEKPENLARIQKLGFTKLVMISESPLHLAVQQVNPKQADQKRETYHQVLTAVAKEWNTLLETEDLLIKEIPRASTVQ
jgi:hypothetical protein